MSKILGTGPDAIPVVGGEDAPQAVAIREAVRKLLHGIYLYGRDGGHGAERGPCRGWRGDIYEALALLHPEAAAHLDKHQDGRLTWRLYGADRELDPEAFEDEVDA